MNIFLTGNVEDIKTKKPKAEEGLRIITTLSQLSSPQLNSSNLISTHLPTVKHNRFLFCCQRTNSGRSFFASRR